MPAAKAEEIKQRALVLLGEGQSVRAVAATLGVGKSTVAEWKLRLGDQPGHDFHGNQYVAGQGGGAANVNPAAWHQALEDFQSGWTQATDRTDANSVYQAQFAVKALDENAGKRFANRAAATAYAKQVLAQYAPDAQVKFSVLSIGDRVIGSTLPEAKPDTFQVVISPRWMVQSNILHELAHVVGMQRSNGVIGHGASFREAYLGMLKGEMPSLAASLSAELAKGGPALNAGEPQIEISGHVIAPDGRAVICLALASKLKMGDSPGHDFHGNQWTGGSGTRGVDSGRFSGEAREQVDLALRDTRSGRTKMLVARRGDDLGVLSYRPVEGGLYITHMASSRQGSGAGTAVIRSLAASAAKDGKALYGDPIRGAQPFFDSLGWHKMEGGWQGLTPAETKAVAGTAKMAESDDDPGSLTAADSLIASGLVVKAQDTGRVLMLQRSFENPEDPAAGNWEFPGGHLEKDADALATAKREWGEELGLDLPDGDVAGSWISPNGIYQGFLYLIPEEGAVDLANRDTSKNPDGDSFEAAAWWAAGDIPGMPALRPECLTSDWNLILRASETASFGDTPGHDFHGNQYAAGAAGRALEPVHRGPFYHGTNVALKSGDTLRPSGSPRPELAHYDPNKVYLTTGDHLAERYAVARAGREGGTPHVYEVKPLGKLERDPEYIKSGFGQDQHIADSGHIVREVPLPGLVKWDAEKSRLMRASEFGEPPGHPFRGNQFATGSGGDGNEKWGKVPGGIAGGKAGDFHGWSGLTPDQNQQRLATIHGLSPNRVSYNGGRGWYDLGTGMSLGPRPDDKAWAASQKWSPQADGLIQTAMQNVKDTGMGEDHPQFWASVRAQATTEAGSRGIQLAESTAPSGGNGDVVIEPDDIVRAPEMEHQGSRPEPHVHDPDDPLPVLVFDLHGTITKTNGFPLIFPPYPLIKEYMDKMAARGACIHIATAGLDELDELVNDARLDEIWRFCDFYALPVSHIGPKANAHVFYDDRMIEVDRDDPHWDQYALQAEELMLLKFDLDPDTGKYVRKDREKTGDPIKEFPSLEESPPDRPRGFTSPILEVDVHRCISYASGSQRTAPLKPGAKEIITQLYNAGYTIQVGCAGWNPATHPRDVWEGRYGAQGQYLYEQGIPFDRRVSKDHGDLFHDDKGMRHVDWYGDFPRLLEKLHGPSPEHNIPQAMAEPKKKPGTAEHTTDTKTPESTPEKTDQTADPQHRKRNQTEGEEPRTGRTAASFERTGPARNEDSPSTPTEPGALQSDSRAMVQERGSQDEKSGTGLPRGESEEVRDVSALGGLPADREMGQTPVDLGLHDHPVLNRLYIEAMNRYANLINNGVARHHALAAVKRIDPDFYIQEAQHAWLYTQLANRAKGQKGHAPSDTDKPDAGPGLPSLGGTPMLAKMGEFDREGLALAIQAFEASGRREPGLLNMGWSPSQPTPPPHVTSVYDQFEWEAGDTQALSDYLANLYREQYLETLNDHLTRSGVAQVSEITDPSVLASLDARAEEVAAGVGDTFNNDLANQTYLTWIDQRSELGTQSSRYTLEQEIDGWANDRADWKADQITSTEAGWATHQAADDFVQNNPDAAATGHVEGPDPAAEPDCQELLDRGTMDAEELAAIDFPIHPNCEHYPVYDIEQDWGSNQDVWSAQASPDDTSGDEMAAAETVQMGDQPGHEFHGNQYIAGSGGGTPAQQAALGSFENKVAAEERARVKTDYRYGPERGLVVDPDGKVIWQGGSNESAHISNIPDAAMQPGNVLTHFHPDTGPAWLSTGDVDQALRTGATVRAFTASGHWQEFTPSKIGGSLGISGNDLLAGVPRPTSDELPAVWTTELLKVIGDKGTLRSGGPDVKAGEALKFYDDSQPRDDHGRWSSDGGGSVGNEEEKSTATVSPQSDDAAALFTKAKREAEQRNWDAQNARDFLNRDFHSQGEIATHLRDAHKIDPNHHLDPNLQLAHARLHSPAYEAIAPPNHTHDLSRRDLALAASELPALFGDVAGHDFHGNQYVAGSGGGLTADEQDMVRRYGGMDYTAINAVLRGDKAGFTPGQIDFINKQVGLIDSAMAKSTLTKDTTVYRELPREAAMKEAGTTVTSPAYVSTTYDRESALQHRDDNTKLNPSRGYEVLQATLAAGTHAIDMQAQVGSKDEFAQSRQRIEKEIVVARNTPIRWEFVAKVAAGEGPGHEFRGNQYVAGASGGSSAADMSMQAWKSAVSESNASMTIGEKQDAFYVYDAESEVSMHFENSGNVYVHPEDAKAYADKLAAQYVPGAKVAFNPSADLEGDAGETTLLAKPDSYRIDVDHAWLSQAVICHEMAHVMATEKVGQIGHGASFREAWMTILQGEMPDLASKIGAELAKSPPAVTLAEMQIKVKARVTTPEGKSVTCFAPAEFTPRKPLQMGDVPGHPFHGNQYTSGSGGSTIADYLSKMSPAERAKNQERFAPSNLVQAKALRGLLARPSAGPQVVDGEYKTDAIRPGFPTDTSKQTSLAQAISGQTGSIENVPLDQLTATKPYLSRTAIAATIKNLDGDPAFARPGYLPLVVKQGGKSYIVDGHHRTEGALLLGQPTIQARVFNLDTMKAGEPTWEWGPSELMFLGDLAGHDFRGNQWVAGTGGAGSPADPAKAAAISPRILSDIQARAQAFYAAGGSVVSLVGHSPASDKLGEMALAKRDAVRGSETYNPVAFMAAALTSDKAGERDRVIVALGPRGDPVCALSYYAADNGVNHVGYIGSSREIRGAGTAVEVELARQSSAGVFAEYTTAAEDFHAAMGRDLVPHDNGVGGYSRWSSAAAAQIAGLPIQAVTRHSELVFTPHDSDQWAAMFAKLRTDGTLKFGDVPGHDFHGNQYTGGMGGGASDGPITPQLQASLGQGWLPRDQMPVVPGKLMATFADSLASQGVTSSLEQVDPRSLTPTQNQLDPVKVQEILGRLNNADYNQKGAALGERHIMVSRDGHILDGHHRWAANVLYAADHPGHRIAILRMNTTIKNLLAQAQTFDRKADLAPKSLAAAESPDPDQPYVQVNGKWVLIATDESDGVPRTLKFGDVPGHPFHGNQYVAGISGAAGDLGRTFHVAGVALEPRLTPALQALAQTVGADLNHRGALDYRVKSEKSLARKIAGVAKEKKISETEAAALINDTNRYTVTLPEQNYTSGIHATLAGLTKQGYGISRVRNYWPEGNQYRGINAQIMTPSGDRFELQFHTPESHDLKEGLNHPLYEQWRDAATPQSERAALDAQMRANSATLNLPPGALKIGELKQE